MAINTGKVVVGGLLAGLVLNVFDMVTQFTIFADDMKAMVARLHLDPAVMQPSAAQIIPWVSVDFLMGILIVWNYAAMRPRFGPGPGTAVKAGLVLYLAVTAVLFGFTTIGVFTMDMFLKQSAVWVVAVIVASAAGGWAYKET